MGRWGRHASGLDVPELGDADSDARPLSRPVKGVKGKPPRRLGRSLAGVGLGALCVAGSAAALLGEHGWIERRRLRVALADMEAEASRERERLAQLEDEVAGLRDDPLARERIAREDLGYTRPEEVLFLLPKEEDATSSEPAAP
jgi:cell division protein FtsB